MPLGVTDPGVRRYDVVLVYDGLFDLTVTP